MEISSAGGAPEPPPEPQPVLTPLTAAAVFLVLTIKAGGEAAVLDLLPDLAGLQRSVGFRSAGSGLACVIGVGSAAWDRLFGGPRPADLHEFRELAGSRHRAVSTPGDLLLHIRAKRMDVCFELAALIAGRLGDAVTVADEVHGFRYFDERDLLGFVDGTENPAGREASAAVTVGAQDPPFAGGSYVIVQKYLHDLPAWNALPVEDQELVVGRTKLTDVELADDVKPANSHVALNTITGPDGAERQIMRYNMPFGTIGQGEFGTYFIGYSATPAVTEQMLENMFIGRGEGSYDRILDFSRAVTGSLFFVPTADLLADPPALSSPAVAGAARSGPATVVPPQDADHDADGSLGIGSLKGRSREEQPS